MKSRSGKIIIDNKSTQFHLIIMSSGNVVMNNERCKSIHEKVYKDIILEKYMTSNLIIFLIIII